MAARTKAALDIPACAAARRTWSRKPIGAGAAMRSGYRGTRAGIEMRMSDIMISVGAVRKAEAVEVAAFVAFADFVLMCERYDFRGSAVAGRVAKKQHRLRSVVRQLFYCIDCAMKRC